MKRLLLVLTEFPPRIGGMQTHAHYLSCYLAESGYDIRVVTYRSLAKAEQESAAQVDAELPFPVRRELSRLSFWYNVDVLTRIAERWKPDLIYSSTIFYGFLRASMRVPVVCRSVGNDVLRAWIAYPFRPASHLLVTLRLDDWAHRTFRRMNSPDWVETWFRAKRLDLVARSARCMDRILANSEFTAELLAGLGVEPEQIQVLVGGVDAKRFSPAHLGSTVDEQAAEKRQLRCNLGIPQDAYVLTTVCRLVPKKGLDFLMQAFSSLRTTMPDAHLVIVGDGREHRACQQRAAELDIEAHTTFAGSVPHSDIHEYYWLSNLFVLASRVQFDPRTGIRDAETMGRVLCEANAAGVPMVATRSGGIPSVVKHGSNGLLFEPDNEADFLAQCGRIRTDAMLVRQLVENGLAKAQNQFDWAVILREHQDCIEEIVSRC